ncbi:N/A [soil metagenome]
MPHTAAAPASQFQVADRYGTIAVTGSTGMIGSALVARLRRDGVRVRRVVRSRQDLGPDDILWDVREQTIDARGLADVDAVVHLAGEDIAQRWTSEARARIRNSRVAGTRLLADALASEAAPPEVLISASAIGIYGNRGDEVLDEGSTPGSDFLAEVAQAWEDATGPAKGVGIRVVHPRFGVVLSPRGGALKKMLPPFKLGVGGKLGSGRQWMSWVSLEDAVRALLFALADPDLAGPVNVTSPNPVTNAELTDALGDVLHRPTFATVPKAALHLAMGEMVESTILASQRVLPERLLEAGFDFEHPEIEGALRSELERG